MITDENAELGGQATAAAAKPRSPLSARSLFMATTVFVCLLWISQFRVVPVRLARELWIGIIVLPAVVLPAYFILRLDRRPWQFSMGSLFVLTAVYAGLLALATSSSFMNFWYPLYRLEMLWVACFYPFFICHFMVKHGWYGGLLALFGVVVLLATLAGGALVWFSCAMSGLSDGPSPGRSSPSATELCVLGGGIIVSVILMCSGVYWHFAARRRNKPISSGK
jgi:hypothetical protein